MASNLGNLRKVPLREIWEHEALSFSKWLAKEENLGQLSTEIGVTLKLLKTEAEIGGFNVDILAEEEGTGKKIVIENQLEVTNHDHLGKLLTYAAGAEASFLIWIFKDIREEHRRAIDWLNEHLTEDVAGIFAVQMELWQIGESLPAPKFQIICKPNDWAKIAKTSVEQSQLTPTKIYQLEFWNQFKGYAMSKNLSLNLTKTNPQHWYNFSVGSSSCGLALSINTKAKELGCELYIPDDKALFDFLFQKREAIEKEIGFNLDWQRLPEDTKAARIKTVQKCNTIGEPDFSKYQEAFEWLRENLERFKKVFNKVVADYK